MGEREIFQELKDVRERIHNKTIVFAKNLKKLNFSEPNTDGFCEYQCGVFIKDITPEEARIRGINMMLIKCNVGNIFDAHVHENQNQTIFVHKGGIVNVTDGVIFKSGDAFYLRKNVEHKMFYRENTEVTVVWFPNLDEE